jgi:hypothetical protein
MDLRDHSGPPPCPRGQKRPVAAAAFFVTAPARKRDRTAGLPSGADPRDRRDAQAFHSRPGRSIRSLGYLGASARGLAQPTDNRVKMVVRPMRRTHCPQIEVSCRGVIARPVSKSGLAPAGPRSGTPLGSYGRLGSAPLRTTPSWRLPKHIGPERNQRVRPFPDDVTVDVRPPLNVFGQRPLVFFPTGKTLLDTCSLANRQRQCHCICKCHVGGLAKVGRHRVSGIAQDGHPPLRPLTAGYVDDAVPSPRLGKSRDKIRSTAASSP